jgi:poly(A) polymerase
LHAPESYPMPEFSLRGADVLDLGVPQGPEVSRLLDAVEAWWIDGGFDADRAACLNELRRRIDS